MHPGNDRRGRERRPRRAEIGEGAPPRWRHEQEVKVLGQAPSIIVVGREKHQLTTINATTDPLPRSTGGIDIVRGPGTRMSNFSSPLKHVKVAAPCQADWDQMFAFDGERVRFCSQCQLNVYNLSGMRRGEAEALLNRAEGRLCVRYYRRADGTILTADCPLGLRAIRRRVAWVAQAVLGMVLSLFANLGFYSLITGRNPSEIVAPRPIHMGAVALPIERAVVPDTSRGIMLSEPAERSGLPQGSRMRRDKDERWDRR